MFLNNKEFYVKPLNAYLLNIANFVKNIAYLFWSQNQREIKQQSNVFGV